MSFCRCFYLFQESEWHKIKRVVRLYFDLLKSYLVTKKLNFFLFSVLRTVGNNCEEWLQYYSTVGITKTYL